MKKVLLKFYSEDNLGDDLFVKIITERYKNTFSVPIRKGMTTFDNISNLKVYKHTPLAALMGKLSRLLNVGDLWVRFLALQNDLLVYVGGSIFIEGDSPVRWQRELDFYKKCSIPFYILGSSFGPYQTNDFIKLVGNILTRASDVCFRDKKSYALFQNLSTTRVATDIAFTLDSEKFQTKADRTVIFSIINGEGRFDDAVTQKYEQSIVDLSNNFVDKNYKVVYMSFCKSEGDEVAISRIVNRLDDEIANKIEVYKYNGDLDSALAVLAKSEIVVAGRFHAAVLGLLFSKKVLPMAYGDKTINLLNDLGFEGPVIDLRKIDDFEAKSFKLGSLIKNDISEQIVLAEAQFQELDKILERR